MDSTVIIAQTTLAQTAMRLLAALLITWIALSYLDGWVLAWIAGGAA